MDPTLSLPTAIAALNTCGKPFISIFRRLNRSRLKADIEWNTYLALTQIPERDYSLVIVSVPPSGKVAFNLVMTEPPLRDREKVAVTAIVSNNIQMIYGGRIVVMIHFI